jgi:hypothetical protein
MNVTGKAEMIVEFYTTLNGVYAVEETAHVVIAVRDGRAHYPVEGGRVNLEINTATGEIHKREGPTDMDGRAWFEFDFDRGTDGLGVYQAKVAVSKDGYFDETTAGKLEMRSNPKAPEVEKYLFLDDFIVENHESVFFCVNRPSKFEGNPILKPDKPWETKDVSMPSVIFDEDEGIFKMWGIAPLCHTISRRGKNTSAATPPRKTGFIGRNPPSDWLTLMVRRRTTLSPMAPRRFSRTRTSLGRRGATREAALCGGHAFTSRSMA